MGFVESIPPWVLILTGLVLGAILGRLLSFNEKTRIQQLLTALAVSEEKLHQFRNLETESKALQELYIETKTKNVELQTRIDEQEKYGNERLTLL